MRELVARLLAWFAGVRRDLPWRRDPEPWRVLVAETMLQQTRVAAVLPRYESFLARFPDPAALAAADEDEVLAEWSGLGYYRRARNLHAAAHRIVTEHGGVVPDDRGALLELPGVGAYTAGAVLSIAFDRPEPIVDGNVERVFARLFLIEGSVKLGAARKRLWELAGQAVRAGPPAEVNQALMELGALVCLPGAPRCGECPLEGRCEARAAGREGDLPVLPGKRETVDVALAGALVERDGLVLLVRAPQDGLVAGTWGPPFAVVPPGTAPEDALRREAARRHRLSLTVEGRIGRFTHAITHHRIRAECYAARAVALPGGTGPRFVSRGDLADYGLSSLAMKFLRSRE